MFFHSCTDTAFLMEDAQKVVLGALLGSKSIISANLSNVAINGIHAYVL